MLLIKIARYLLSLERENSLVLIQGSIFHFISNWCFVNKIEECFGHFLVRSNDWTNGMLCSVKCYLNSDKALGHFKATDSRMSVHPAHCIQHLCLRVLAISLALCLSLLCNTAAMVKNREKEQQDIVQFWSVCQQWQNVVFLLGLRILVGFYVFSLGWAWTHKDFFFRFIQLEWKPWVSGKKVVSCAPVQTFLSWTMTLWLSGKEFVVKHNRKMSSSAVCWEDTCRAAAGVEVSHRLYG